MVRFIITLIAVCLAWPVLAHQSASRLDIGEMANQSDLVFRGTVVNIDYRESEARGDQAPLPYTFVTYAVEEVLFGQYQESELTLRFLGGITERGEILTNTSAPKIDLGDEDILISDVGAHKMWIARHYQCHQPNTCLIPNGFCSMGFALPGAIAASMVHPDRRILAIAGDAGFLMNVQEMETARRLNANIVVMVWEDHMYGLIAWKQDTEFGHHTDLSFTNPDWKQLAHAFNWHGHRVDNSRELANVLENAFQESGPSLIVLPIDYRENAILTQRLGEITCPI